MKTHNFRIKSGMYKRSIQATNNRHDKKIFKNVIIMILELTDFKKYFS